MRAGTALLALCLAVTAAGQDLPSNYGNWYLARFPLPPPRDRTDRRLLQEAREVFARLSAVADSKPGREARLLVVGKDDTEEAQALPDGAIVINLRLLRLCFVGVEPDHGRARLAFILGHEMAHLAHDDSWHPEAFAMSRRYADDHLREATRGWAEELPESRKAKEVHADEEGFRFMMMAGYPPEGVLAGPMDFLEQWAARVAADTFARGPDTGSPFPERAIALRLSLLKLAEVVTYFRFGTRLAQLGRHDDAVTLLQEARRKFPSREVHSNYGLALYQRALSRLAEHGCRNGVEYRLPIMLDPDTLLSRLNLRGSADPDCLPWVATDLKDAERALHDAVADVSYLPARLNLVAVLLLKGEPALALGEALKGQRADPRLKLMAAVAQREVGRTLDRTVDMDDSSLRELEDLVAHCDGASPPGCGGRPASLATAAVFNQARILQRRGSRNESARLAWEDFLRREPVGAFADEARDALLKMGVEVPPPPPAPAGAGKAPRARLLDRLLPPVRRRLLGGKREAFTLGDLRGAALSAPGLAALELRGTIELIEETLEPGGSCGAEVRNRPPRSVYEQQGDRRTLVYPDAALDCKGDRLVRRVLFQAR